MDKFEEQLKLSKATNKGIIKRFQEKSSYKMAINEHDCPYCEAEFGNGVIRKTVEKDIYETPKNIRHYINGREGYSWTEDCKCGNCGEMYSQYNGC